MVQAKEESCPQYLPLLPRYPHPTSRTAPTPYRCRRQMLQQRRQAYLNDAHHEVQHLPERTRAITPRRALPLYATTKEASLPESCTPRGPAPYRKDQGHQLSRCARVDLMSSSRNGGMPAGRGGGVLNCPWGHQEGAQKWAHIPWFRHQMKLLGAVLSCHEAVCKPLRDDCAVPACAIRPGRGPGWGGRRATPPPPGVSLWRKSANEQ